MGNVQAQAPMNMYVDGFWKGLPYISKSLETMGIPVSLANDPHQRYPTYKAKFDTKGPKRLYHQPRVIHFQKAQLAANLVHEVAPPISASKGNEPHDRPQRTWSPIFAPGEIKQESMEDDDCQIIEHEPEMVVDPPEDYIKQEREEAQLPQPFGLEDIESFLKDNPIDFDHIEETDEVKMFLEKTEQYFENM